METLFPHQKSIVPKSTRALFSEALLSDTEFEPHDQTLEKPTYPPQNKKAVNPNNYDPFLMQQKYILIAREH